MVNINKDNMYVWLSTISDFNYLIYLRLLRVFGTIEELFYSTKEKMKFRETLIKENIFLSRNLIEDLTSEHIKSFSLKIYDYLISNNIKIISVDSKNYPKKLFNLFNSPICIYIKGDIDLLKNSLVYLHHDDNFSIYGKNIYVDISMYLRNKNVYKVGIKGENSDIIVKSINKAKFFEDINLILNSEKNYIFVITSINSKFIDLEVLACFIDFCVIPEFGYEKEVYIKFLIDILINESKDILVAPGSIYSKLSYFSNYLLKEGAEMLLSKKDLDKYIK